MSVHAHLCDQVKKLCSEKLNLDVPSIETDLVETGMLDSMQFVQLLLHLEEEFGVAVSLDNLEFDHFRSIGKIAEFISNHT